jgi:Resolvase, N terminal domain
MTRKVLRKLDGYVRVSRVGRREGDSFVSPQLQRDRIEVAARNAGAEIVEWHEDLDESGGNAERPGFGASPRAGRGEADGRDRGRQARSVRAVGLGRAEGTAPDRLGRRDVHFGGGRVRLVAHEHHRCPAEVVPLSERPGWLRSTKI